MRLIITADYAALSARAAALIAAFIRSAERPVLGLPTGGTPIGTYAELVRLHREEGLSFRQVTTFNLDEYLGLPPTHPQSYHTFMRTQLFDYVDILPENVHLPSGSLSHSEISCEKYEELIRSAGGIGLQVVGIGGNGHIGFNEPGSSFAGRTHVHDLAERTRQDNARFFAGLEEVPRQAITMGIGTILEAAEIVQLASGSGKADILARTWNGPAGEEVPSSALQRHPQVTVIADAAAAADLEKK